MASDPLSMSDLATIRPKGAGNATVPGGAPIQPAQAFVDTMLSTVSGHAWPYALDSGDPLPWSGKGIASIDATWLIDVITAASDAVGTYAVDLSNNAIDATSVNAILAAMAATASGFSGSMLHLSGGTNAAPTGQGLTDKQTLIDNGWTVTTN